MAISKTQKGRVDFGLALGEALYVNDGPNQKEDRVVEQEIGINDNNIMSTNDQEGPTDHDGKNNNLFLSLVKGERGTQRSVYFESDVYEYVNNVAKKYGVNFSNVVNLLLKEAMKSI